VRTRIGGRFAAVRAASIAGISVIDTFVPSIEVVKSLGKTKSFIGRLASVPINAPMTTLRIEPVVAGSGLAPPGKGAGASFVTTNSSPTAQSVRLEKGSMAFENPHPIEVFKIDSSGSIYLLLNYLI
jgi:hypothetical protein